MYLVRVLLNGILIAAEIGAAVGLAWAALHHPMIFAAATAGAAFLIGIGLEIARLRNELKFYFGTGTAIRGIFVPFVGVVEALFKGIVAGVAATFTFAGTDQGRLFWIAVAFGLTIYAGATVLRWLSIGLEARPERWGFFRLGPPLGLLFSALVTLMAAYGLIAPVSVGDIGWTIVWEMPRVPTIEQVSELLFRIKQAFDGFVVTILANAMPLPYARIVGVIISVNVLAGFVAAFYAALVASIVRWCERRLP